MDEQVLKLFAEVGPHAQEALESWLHLQWVKMFLDVGMCGAFIIIMVLIIFILWKKA